MIDLSRMKSIRVDAVARTVRAEPGVLGGEFDRETQAFGLATPVGTVSTTGIAGLTLGGRQSWPTPPGCMPRPCIASCAPLPDTRARIETTMGGAR
jgi:hypothetical protein